MRMIMRVIIIEVVALLLLLFHCIDAKTYIVGDGLNWVDPPTSTIYSTWANTHVFTRGDVLVFNFNAGIHNVAEVTKKGYNKCNTSALIAQHYKPPVRISLHERGVRYFISTLNNDCQSGQKLAINVLQHLPPPPLATPTPEIAPHSSGVSPPLPSAAPNNRDAITLTPPPPERNAAPSYFGPNHLLLTTLFVSFILELLY